MGFLLLLVCVLAASVRAETPGPTTRPAGSRAVVIPVEGEINSFTAIQFKKRLEDAKKQGVDTIILRMDTPGGLVMSALDMVDELKALEGKVRTVAYVKRWAYSAGSMISVACDEIVMAPGSMIGDCAPIIPSSSGGLENIEGANRAKMESPIVASFEDAAARHGYDPLLLRAFVQYQVSVYIAEKDGQRKFATKEQWEQLKSEGWKLATDIKNPVDDELTLLTVNEITAKKLGLSRGTFPTIEAFAEAANLSIDQVYETTAGESIIKILSSDGLRGLLSIIFTLSIYFVFSKPGSGIAESAAIVSGIVLFGVPMLTGYAGWLEILLILIGLAMIALEIFVIPGFGITGITGIILLLMGLVLTYVPSEAPALPTGDHNILPQLPQTQQALKEGLVISTIGLATSLGLWWWLSKYITKVPYMNRLVLTTSVGQTVEPQRDIAREQAEDAWPAIGVTGTVVSDLRTGGVARFFDPIVNDQRNADVVSDHGYVVAGTRVVVRAKEGTRIVVRAITEEANA